MFGWKICKIRIRPSCANFAKRVGLRTPGRTTIFFRDIRSERSDRKTGRMSDTGTILIDRSTYSVRHLSTTGANSEGTGEIPSPKLTTTASNEEIIVDIGECSDNEDNAVGTSLEQSL